jgi:hypothetical protein
MASGLRVVMGESVDSWMLGVVVGLAVSLHLVSAIPV